MNQPFNPLTPQNNPGNQDYRIGDAERQKAMDDLGKHFAAGRLDITEYDNRLTNVAEATMRSDLIPIFSDLPAITDANTPVAIPHAAGIPDEVTFTSSEIEENYRSGKRIRLGITLLAFLPFLATFHLETIISGITFIAFLAIFIMLYILKLGPKSWHQPSPRALARQRRRQIAQAQAMQVQAMELANAQQMAQQRLLRQQRQAEITNAALEVTNQYVQRLRNRHSR
ncbi:DUF1707 domain-containing protein [Corynebacterium matruchotii]|uniref:DUF1707 SHOCT-like domain-containing protein n=1 Tax=Corynebacterium matruchotii TaxID=43768 RepID=UPI0028E71359|nr:DUF1707 domain-containing protein [Corynebacterium matruchotii]